MIWVIKTSGQVISKLIRRTENHEQNHGRNCNDEKTETAKRMLEIGVMAKEISEDLELSLSIEENLVNELQSA